jgi:hypothetical protein
MPSAQARGRTRRYLAVLRITSSAAFANAADHLIHQMRVPLIREDDGHEN